MAYVVALYAGDKAHDLELVSVTTDPHITCDFAQRMLLASTGPHSDPARAAIENGKRSALKIVARSRSRGEG